jgi:hypothetical protein
VATKLTAHRRMGGGPSTDPKYRKRRRQQNHAISGSVARDFTQVARLPTGTSLASQEGMSSHVPTSSPSYHIPKQKRLVWRFDTSIAQDAGICPASVARLAVDRMMEFPETTNARRLPNRAA